MPDATAKEVADKLLASNFARSEPGLASLSDPIADTPMVVTLDELRPYESNPRVTRNPRYDEIKASILARGLDAPPPITRRPGELTFIIRNGGNTRLAILRELWSETRDEQFFRLRCLFRPWSARGEIIVLTGHLAENDLHGGLSFIERALGVERARELYEAENAGRAITQIELARRLTADGYPIAQSHISRMQDAVRHLLPAIPSVLYGGLGKHQVERLTTLRKAAARVHDRHTPSGKDASDFPAVFQDVLAQFDGSPTDFDVQRVQDELISQLSTLLGIDYDTLILEIVDADTRQPALNREPSFHVEQTTSEPSTVAPEARTRIDATATPPKQPQRDDPRTDAKNAPAAGPSRSTPEISTASTPSSHATAPVDPPKEDRSAPQWNERLQGHIVSPAETTDRLQSIQRLVADATGDSVEDFKANVLRAIPVQAGGLYPISDVWYIEPPLDAPDRLRAHIAQFASEIAQEAGAADHIEPVDDGIGFRCSPLRLSSSKTPESLFPRATLILLGALSTQYLQRLEHPGVDDVRLGEYLGALLQGMFPSHRFHGLRLSDAGLVKLFRLIRLARRLVELQGSP